MNVLGRGLLAVTNRSAVRKLITGTGPGRALSTRFVAGETLEQAITVAVAMNEKGASVSLDHRNGNCDRLLECLAGDEPRR